METIVVDSPDRLVVKVRSPLQSVSGLVGLAFLAWLAVHWLAHNPNTNRFIGLIGASATCLLFALFSESGDFAFDGATSRLSWTRRSGIMRRSGNVPFSEIEQVVVRTALGSSSAYPSERICLLTRSGELPLTMSYSPSRKHAEHAERLRAFLGLTGSHSPAASVESLVAAGQDVDAIRELLARTRNVIDRSARRGVAASQAALTVLGGR